MKISNKLYDTYAGYRYKLLLPFIYFKKRILKKIIDNNSYYDIPNYIVSFNRFDYLKNTINWLKSYGYNKIIIIDNKSTLSELLEYYKTCGLEVIRMKDNCGHKVFHRNIKFLIKRNKGVYVLTDPDLEPIKDCPKNFMEVFVKALYAYPTYSKVGFSLKYDDLPNILVGKDLLLKDQESFHKNVLKEINGIKYYDSQIDTTFALNSPTLLMPECLFCRAIRVGEPYQLCHLPWYEENHDQYYIKTKLDTISRWYSKK